MKYINGSNLSWVDQKTSKNLWKKYLLTESVEDGNDVSVMGALEEPSFAPKIFEHIRVFSRLFFVDDFHGNLKIFNEFLKNNKIFYNNLFEFFF